MNLKLPIQDVILAFGTTGFALSPWPWLALLFAAVWLIGIALLVDARTSRQDTEPAPGATGGEA